MSVGHHQGRIVFVHNFAGYATDNAGIDVMREGKGLGQGSEKIIAYWTVDVLVFTLVAHGCFEGAKAGLQF